MAANQHSDEEKDLKPDETQDDADTSSAKSQKPAPEEEVDYRVKFTESQKEALRLREEARKKEEELKQVEDVMTVLSENPELLSQVQSAYDRKNNPTRTETGETGTVADKVNEHKVREVVKPIQETVEALQRERNEEVLGIFFEQHPDVAPGTPKADEFVENLKIMSKAQVPIREGLKKAYELTQVAEVRRTGKTETLKGIFERQQASAGSGSSAAAGRRSEPELTPAEKKIADNLGIKHEDYIKQKAQK